MKFSQGAWRWADGVTPSVAKVITEANVDGDKLVVRTLDSATRHGVDRFEGTVLTLEITSPMPDVIRVHMKHHAPAEVGVARFDLDYDLKAEGVTIEESDDGYRFTSGNLTLVVGRKPFKLTFLDADGNVVTTGEQSASMRVRGERRPDPDHGWLVEGLRPGHYLSQQLSLGVDECVYGLGERFGPIARNGQTVAIWNEDGGTSSDLAYKNVPFYLSSRGYGLLVNNPRQVDFEIATAKVGQTQFSVPGEDLDFYVFLGPKPLDILEKYTRLSGRPALPPAWSFGLWLSTSFTTDYDEATVNSFIDGMAERDIPLSVFHFDCFWMKERHWCNFQWDKDAFPEPEAMLKRLHDRGLKVCVWINSYISQMSELFAEARDAGYLLMRKDGRVYQRDAWQPGIGLVDFTNPRAVKWYQGHLKRLMKMGVDAFKTDFAELIPTDVQYHDGSDPSLMHNYYTYLYNKAVFEVIEDVKGRGEAVLFARSATVGGQKFPVHWGGDCSATFEAMAEDLRGGLSFCTSGAAFWSHDIGGFEGTANPACYKRWVQMGLLSTHSRLHGSGSYRVPWIFDDEAVDVMRRFTKLKNTLFPYLFGAANDAHKHGWPVMRAMAVAYPGDPACRHLGHQYLLGDSLLVAPIFSDDGRVTFYLPPGRWTHLLSGDEVDGGRFVTEAHDFFSLPLYVRPNSIVARSANEQSPEWTLGNPVTLHLYALDHGATATTRIAGSDGNSATVTATRSGSTITVASDAPLPNARVVVGGKAVEWSDAKQSLSIDV